MADLAAEAAAAAASRKEHIIEVGRGGKEGGGERMEASMIDERMILL